VFNSTDGDPTAGMGEMVRVCAGAADPGSFVIVPLFCLVRHGMVRAGAAEGGARSASSEARQRIN
jgi:hypothetical protein